MNLKLHNKKNRNPKLAWRIRKFLKHGTPRWIMGRYACLGSEVMNRLNSNAPIYNIQKGRVDYLARVSLDASFKTQPELIAPHLESSDLLDLAKQQCLAPHPKWGKPQYYVMDSFSELTDQLFIHKKGGWGVCYNWSDLAHDETFNEAFDAMGLMSLDEIAVAYDAHFKEFSTHFPTTPIMYLFFSTALDTREKFNERNQGLRNIINDLKGRYPNLLSVDLKDSQVNHPTSGDDAYRTFPYHYSSETYDVYADQCSKKLRDAGIMY